MCGAEHTAGARGFRVHIVQEYGKHPSPRARRADATGPTRPDGESSRRPDPRAAVSRIAAGDRMRRSARARHASPPGPGGGAQIRNEFLNFEPTHSKSGCDNSALRALRALSPQRVRRTRSPGHLRGPQSRISRVNRAEPSVGVADVSLRRSSCCYLSPCQIASLNQSAFIYVHPCQSCAHTRSSCAIR